MSINKPTRKWRCLNKLQRDGVLHIDESRKNCLGKVCTLQSSHFHSPESRCTQPHQEETTEVAVAEDTGAASRMLPPLLE